MEKRKTLSKYFLSRLSFSIVVIAVVILLLNIVFVKLFKDFVHKNIVLTICNHVFKTTELMMLSLLDLHKVSKNELELILDTVYDYFSSNPNSSDKEIEQLIAQLWRKDEPLNWYLISSNGIIERTNYPSDLGVDLSMKKSYWERLSSLNSGQKQFDPITFEVRTGLPRFFAYVKLSDGRFFELGLTIGSDQLKRFFSAINELSNASEVFVSASFFTENYAPISPAYQLSTEDKSHFENLRSSELLFISGRSGIMNIYGTIRPKDCPFSFKAKITLNLLSFVKTGREFLVVLNSIFAAISIFFLTFSTALAASITRSVRILVDHVSASGREKSKTGIIEIDELIKRYDELLAEAKQDALRMSEQIGKLLSQLREQSEKQRELTKLASTDEMTGVLNRRAAMQILKKLSESRQSTVSICYFDVDHLKKTNDTFGHDVGDILLKYVIGKVRKHLRKSDYIARMGGDEFLIILPEVQMKECELIMKRVQNKLNDEEKPEQLKDVEVSISYGIVEVKQDDEFNLTEVLKKLDQLMYEHKGRHQQRY